MKYLNLKNLYLKNLRKRKKGNLLNIDTKILKAITNPRSKSKKGILKNKGEKGLDEIKGNKKSNIRRIR